MRKTLLVMAVLLFAAPAFAGTVALTVTDEGGLWAAIRYDADANVSGFGLKIYADSGAVITDINDYKVGECTANDKGYGIFPGTIDINVTGAIDDDGLPIAPNDDPGAAGTGLGTSAIVVEMGALYEEGNEPDLSGTLILVKVDGDCNVCVEGEPVRGNVVLTDANEAILDLTGACASIASGPTECVVVGQTVGGVLITQAMYDQWVVVGKPDCWCYDCHSKADTDGDCDADIDDVTEAVNGWLNYPAGNGECADTDNDGDVDIDDITALVDGWLNGCGTCTPIP